MNKKGSCWEGYVQKGMKKKGNRMVPNCVPAMSTGGLTKWFNEKWVDIGAKKKGGKYQECGRKSASMFKSSSSENMIQNDVLDPKKRGTWDLNKIQYFSIHTPFNSRLPWHPSFLIKGSPLQPRECLNSFKGPRTQQKRSGQE